MTNVTIETEEPQLDQPTLKAIDRCDKCGPSARAWVRLEFDNKLILDFCGSCYAQREELILPLTESGRVVIVDERQFIS